VAAVVWGWGVAQYPVLLPGTAVTLTNAGAPQATLVALVVWSVVVVLVIGPSFALLFALQGRRLLHADEAEALPAVTSAGQTQPPAAPWGQPPADQSPVIRAIVVLVAFFRRPRHR
jgi:cytochrome d ubiquinol oxidase subunit II